MKTAKKKPEPAKKKVTKPAAKATPKAAAKPVADKKGKTPKAPKLPKVSRPAEHRVTTHDGAKSTSMAVAAEPAALDLGPIVMPDDDQVVGVLRALAELNDRALQAQKRYFDARDKAKALKEKWESLAEEVQTKLRAATHGSELPLFDEVEREQDHARMIAPRGDLMAQVEALKPGDTLDVPKGAYVEPDPAAEDAPGEAIEQEADLSPDFDEAPF